jgi:hypothetical protein
MFISLSKKFHEMGADLQIKVRVPARFSAQGGTPIVIDIANDSNGREFFDIGIHPDFKENLDLQVLEVLPSDRHLTMVARELDDNGRTLRKHHFLCGHDERHWFVASVEGVSTVREAKASLKPVEVTRREDRLGLNTRRRNRRRNEAFVRQGEWFFIPSPQVAVANNLILRNEPLRRTGSKAHMAEFAYRNGGERVMVSDKHQNGVTFAQYNKLIKRTPQLLKLNWVEMRRNAAVFVRGRISHPDHATILLPDWHRVVMNTERQTETVAFLD